MRPKRQTKSPKKAETAPAPEETETHRALLNDVVLQDIFKFLGFKDLKSCRNVKNITWLRNSKKVWWARAKVSISENIGDSKPIADYLKQTEIHSNAINYKLEGIRGSLINFFDRFGQSIKYLELSSCSFRNPNDFCQIIFTKCPNLEKLISEYTNIETLTGIVEPTKWEEPKFGMQNNLKFLTLKFNGDNLPCSWMQLLSHFPNLKGLELFTELDVFKVISIIRQHDPKMLKINHIDIHGSLGSDSEKSIRLVLLDPKLEFETVRLSHGTIEPETVLEILDLHTKSLKQLRLVGHDSRSPMEITPREPMEELEKLRIFSCLFTADIFKYTPNLKRVHLNYDGTYNLLKNFDPNLRIPTCKELTLEVYGRWRDSQNSDLAFYLRTFPNVEIFETCRLNNFKFSLICEHWTKLVTFRVPTQSEVDVAGLLGFDAETKNKTNRKPNITNLKDLQEFVMGAKQLRGKQIAARGALGIEMKNGEVVLRELETLPNLQKFQLNDYQLKNERVWKKIFAKYAGN